MWKKGNCFAPGYTLFHEERKRATAIKNIQGREKAADRDGEELIVPSVYLNTNPKSTVLLLKN